MPDNEQSRAAITGAAENETQLLPCPFCGGEAEHINSHAEDYWVGCTVCSAAVLEPFQNEAVRQWNTRPLSRRSADAAALEEKVRRYEELVGSSWSIQIGEDWFINRRTDGRFNLVDHIDTVGEFDTVFDAVSEIKRRVCVEYASKIEKGGF